MAVEIIMLVDIDVQTLTSVCPLQHDLPISYGFGVDTCSLRYRKNARQLYVS